MTARRDLGDFGERIAAHRLEFEGMTVIERNARVGRIEIDLVMRDRDEVVFVEVRTRRGAPGLAAES
ncbi:MAG TPA: YraN family protein, partial [Tepidiformaceae bacterium]|nr:YraN family protein [Tepidiformaceae bacterium]